VSESTDQQSDAGVEAETDPTRNADFIFTLDERHFLADAKYKLDAQSLSAADGYQMFAYSHTASVPVSGDEISSGVVIYPRRVTGAGRSRGHGRRKLVRATEPRFDLRLVDLPFPSPADVGTDAAWRDYVSSLASSIRQELSESP
jgi:5-methylcytosine-specific restriction endonuclease McrBC regulatory subunit McrC